MKKIFLPALFIFLSIFASNKAYANVFASGVKISDVSVTDYNSAGNSWDQNFADGSGLKIWFVINEAGVGNLTATVLIKNGDTVVKTLAVSSPAAGVNYVEWDGLDDSNNPAAVGSYSFEVTVSDPVGHTNTDELWMSGANTGGGSDFDGGGTFGYRGDAAITDQTSFGFGNIYIARGSSASLNGLYELRADGEYVKRIGTEGITWPASIPNEVAVVGGKIFALGAYGYTGAGFFRAFTPNDVYTDSGSFQAASVRGFAIQMKGNDTIFYTGRTEGTVGIVMKVGVNGDTSTFANMTNLISGSGYIKSLAVGNDGRVYAAYGNSSGTRKKLAVFDANGTLVINDSLDAHGLSSTSTFHSLAYYNGGKNGTPKLYALVNGGTSAEWGFYEVDITNPSSLDFTLLYSPSEGQGSGATSQQIATDAAGNIIWSNGNTQERIVAISPADGPNTFSTVNPTGYDIEITTILPVELSSFTSIVSGKNVVLHWQTATETNNKGFEVERKINNAWTKIGFVNGAGTTTEKQSYSYTDGNVAESGKISYRLKQIDLDGTFEYSNETEVNILTPDQFELSQNYPNPFNPTTNINFTIPTDSRVRLEIFSLTGELVSTLVNEQKSAGTYDVNFNASSLASGTYIYRLIAGNIVLSKKMILMK